MSPKKFTATLRQIASKIEEAKNPSRVKVSSSLRKLIAAINLPPEVLDWTFHKAINTADFDLIDIVQAAVDEINEACINNPNSPRDAGVTNPGIIAANPIKIDKIDIMDADTGSIVISGGGLAYPVEVFFSADEIVSDWMNESLLEALPSSI